jgi:class 3 adenylate cyclase
VSPTPADNGGPRLLIREPDRDPIEVPLRGRFFVGRVCEGVDPAHRHLVADPEVSRNHLELRIDGLDGRVVALDMSTNGTRLNGALLERAVPTPVRHGDHLSLGRVDIEVLGAPEVSAAGPLDEPTAVRRVANDKTALVAGDIVGYSSLSQHVQSDVLIETVGRLFSLLRPLLAQHGGTLGHYAGDAFLGVWTSDDEAANARAAVEFALAADDAVRNVGSQLPLAAATGHVVRMGWGVTIGPTAIAALSGSLITVLGDTVNLAFRVASIAGREGRAPVLASAAVRELAAGAAEYGGTESYEVKGRTGAEPFHPVWARDAHSPRG